MSLYLFRSKIFEDSRGQFTETFSNRWFDKAKLAVGFVQDNMSRSLKAGTVRGMHFQCPPYAQAKFVSCDNGSLIDVVVDIRTGSPTYGHSISVELTAERPEYLYIPAGFAHGFMTLEDDTVVRYKVSSYYEQAAEGGLLWDDPDLAIDWPKIEGAPVLSSKDITWPTFKNFVSPFHYDDTPFGMHVPD